MMMWALRVLCRLQRSQPKRAAYSPSMMAARMKRSIPVCHPIGALDTRSGRAEIHTDVEIICSVLMREASRAKPTRS